MGLFGIFYRRPIVKFPSRLTIPEGVSSCADPPPPLKNIGRVSRPIFFFLRGGRGCTQAKYRGGLCKVFFVEQNSLLTLGDEVGSNFKAYDYMNCHGM